MQVEEILDKNVWEKFVLESGIESSFFQSWNWGEFEEAIGKDIMRLGFFRDRELLGVASLANIKAKRGNFLHVRNGPLMNWRSEENVKEAFQALAKIAREKRQDFIRISPLVPKGEQEERLLRQLGYVNCQQHDVDAEITWMLELDQTEDQILANMRKNTRYYIRKAVKDGVKIIKTKDPSHLEHFWPIYEDTVKRQQWSAYGRDYIRTQFELFVKDDQTQLFLAEYEGKYIAAAIFIYYGDQVYYHHSGSLTEFRSIPAPYLLQWESILEAKKREYKKYNFFGIARGDDKDHPWYGLSFFKKGFGGYEQEWMHAKDLPLKPKYWLTHYFEKVERKRRGYD